MDGKVSEFDQNIDDCSGSFVKSLTFAIMQEFLNIFASIFV